MMATFLERNLGRAICILVFLAWFAIVTKAQTDFGTFIVDSTTKNDTIDYNEYPEVVDGDLSTCYNDGFNFDLIQEIAVTRIKIKTNLGHSDANGIDALGCEFQPKTSPSKAKIFICSPAELITNVFVYNPAASDICEITVYGFGNAPSVVAGNIRFSHSEEPPFEVNVAYTDDHYQFFPKTKFESAFGTILVESDNTSQTLISAEQIHALLPTVDYELNVTRILDTMQGPQYNTTLSRGPICWVGQCDEKCAEIFTDGRNFIEQTSSDGVCTYINRQPQMYKLSEQPSCVEYCRVEANSSPNECDEVSKFHCCEEDKCLSPVETPSTNQTCTYILKNSDSESDTTLVSNCGDGNNPDGNTPDQLSCWNFNCGDVTCDASFDDSLATTDPTSVKSVLSDNGKCVITESNGIRTFSADPGAVDCTNYCKYDVATVTGNNDFNCKSYRTTYCCDDQDFCLSPKEVRDNTSCSCILLNSGEPASLSLISNCGDVAAQCQASENNNDQIELTPFDLPPNPISYTTLTAESGYLTFSVNETVTGFDYVNLFINEGTDAYVCMANGTFEGNQNYTCIIPGLATNTMYNITLQGHNPDRDNGTVDGLTEISEMYSINQGGTFSLTCGSDGYHIEFFFGDLTASKASVMLANQATPETSKNGTVFDELVTIQSSWYGEMVFAPPISIFKGFPNAIVVQNESDPIVILASSYDFIEIPTYNGHPDAYDETLIEMFNLTDRRVVSVSGSFSNGVLTSIQFDAVDAIGEKVESNCYGGGDCSEFTLNQTDSNQFFVGFAGKTNEDGRIVELRTHWTSVSNWMYYVGTEDCMVNTEYDWNDISKTKYSYTVKPSDACGTVDSVVEADGSHTVVYDNTVSRQTDNEPSGADTFGEGSMKASRQLSGALANVKCSYQADGDVIALFDTGKEKNLKVVDIDSVPFELDFYTDNSYSNPISSEGVLSVVSGERLYFGVSFKDMSAMDMTLYAHMCYAKKDNNPEFSNPSEILVLEEDGCPKEDNSFMRMESVRSSAGEMMDPLSIQAFYWFDDPNMVVYLHCKVRACPLEETDNCTAPTTCDGNQRRRRREIMIRIPDSPTESFASSQPILIQKEIIVLGDGRIPVDGGQMWLSMSVFCGIMTAFLAIILNAFRKQKLNNLLNYQRLKSY